MNNQTQDKRLGFGCMRLPLVQNGDQTSIDMAQFEQMVDAFLAKGFTYFDTAYMYHDYKSEAAVGKALVARHPRDSFTIATKLSLLDLKAPGDCARMFAEQLGRLQTDYVDYYLIHGIARRKQAAMDIEDTFAFVQEKKAEGKIRHIGFSFHDDAEYLDQLLTEHPEMEFVQIQLNYLDWEHPTIQSRACYEVCRKHGKPIIVMEPVKGGTLAALPPAAEQVLQTVFPGSSPASWALRFAAGLPGVMMVLSGMSNLSQMEENLSVLSDPAPLTDEEQNALQSVTDIINGVDAVACTACHYCTEGCPQRIAIPDYFALYNAEKRALNKGFSTQKVYYMNLIRENGKAGDCIGCGQCEQACPQHLPIIEDLKKVAEVFE